MDDDGLQKTALPLGAMAAAAARFLLPKLLQGGRAAARAWNRVPSRDKLEFGLDADDLMGNGPAPQAPQESQAPVAPRQLQMPVPISRPDRIGNVQRAVLRDRPPTIVRGA